MDLLKELYYDPGSGFLSPDKLYKKAKAKDNTITRDMVAKFLKKQEIEQLYSKKKNYYNSFVAPEPDYQWQMDVGFFKDKPILFLVDVFSKKAYAELMKNETAEEVVRILTDIFKQNKPQEIYSDNGSNFENAKVSAFLKKHNVVLIFANGRHAPFVEVLIKTIKGIMQKAYKNITTNLPKLLHAVIANYNDTEHSTIKMTPNEAELQENWATVKKNIEKKAHKIPKSQMLKVGDFVRIKIEKETFEKGYTMRWSKDIYEIEQVKGNRYKLIGKDGLYYHNQLKEVEAPDTVDVEPVQVEPKQKRTVYKKEAMERQKDVETMGPLPTKRQIRKPAY